jgi:DHA1 family inner membrane transport protein
MINAINVSMINLGIGIGATITGLLIDSAGISAVGWAGACFILLALCIRMRITRSQEAHNN